jgi:hypothetical protein
MIEDAYRCPIDLIAHGVPHRVFPEHVVKVEVEVEVEVEEARP